MITGGGGGGAPAGRGSWAVWARRKSRSPLSTPFPPDHCHSRSQAAGSLENHCALAWEPVNPDGKSSWACSFVNVHSAVLLSWELPKIPAHEPDRVPPEE